MPYSNYFFLHLTDIPNCPFYQVLMLHILGLEENIMNELTNEHDARISEMAILENNITHNHEKVMSLVNNLITITCE